MNMETLFQQMGHQGDGALTLEEAIAMTAGNKLDTSGNKPLKKDRRHVLPELKLGDMPLKFAVGTKLTQFVDIITGSELRCVTGPPRA